MNIAKLAFVDHRYGVIELLLQSLFEICWLSCKKIKLKFGNQQDFNIILLIPGSNPSTLLCVGRHFSTNQNLFF